MARSKRFYLAIVIFSISTVVASIIPMGSVTCPVPDCRDSALANWDFSITPKPKMTAYPTPDGISIIPTP
jgi:hypothetical protein